jgi:hypothetical protein
VRLVAGFDYERTLEVARWPIREGLISYVERVKELTEANFRHASLLYQVRTAFGGSKEKPPALPPLLKE